jgi:hypothetical protein
MSTAATVRRAVLFAALEQIAKHHTSRDLLVDDSKTKVDLSIKGHVKTFEVKEAFSGQLIVGPPSTRSTSVACDQVELLAVLASKLSAKKRAELFAYLIESFANDKALPAADGDVLAECKTLLTALRWSKPQTSRGSVRFEVA